MLYMKENGHYIFITSSLGFQQEDRMSVDARGSLKVL